MAPTLSGGACGLHAQTRIQGKEPVATITKLILKNFRKFRSLELDLKADMTILVGANEAGKSSILQAIDLVLSASRSKVEAIGLEALFNAASIQEFLGGARKITDLPVLWVEVYFDGALHHELDGRNNSKGGDHVGIKMVCKPIDDYTQAIEQILKAGHDSFPFEYYAVHFQTFTDSPVFPYAKPLRHLLIDSSQINNEYATREYTRSMYDVHAEPAERTLHGFEYRKAKNDFTNTIFKPMNDTLETFKFDVRSSPKASLDTDLIITEDGLSIDSKGKGRQCFIKTEFALRNRKKDLDVVLLEEPENHLSHVHMHKLIERIRESKGKQLILATHSSFIATRLNLRNVIILSEESPSEPTSLASLTPDTANFFMKAPDNNILELSLAQRAILVEGDAEFILMGSFYASCAGGRSTEADGVHVLSVDGTSFKRYLELAKSLGIKVAAIRDNDGDYQVKCIDRYTEHVSDTIKIFADRDSQRYTFEVCIYDDNVKVCEAEFGKGRKTLTVRDYMLNNKTDAAFHLLDKRAGDLVVPDYIQEAIAWIRP
jgi:putative ATP-dependent endonuclease of OLD family